MKSESLYESTFQTPKVDKTFLNRAHELRVEKNKSFRARMLNKKPKSSRRLF